MKSIENIPMNVGLLARSIDRIVGWIDGWTVRTCCLGVTEKNSIRRNSVNSSSSVIVSSSIWRFFCADSSWYFSSTRSGGYREERGWKRNSTPAYAVSKSCASLHFPVNTSHCSYCTMHNLNKFVRKINILMASDTQTIRPDVMFDAKCKWTVTEKIPLRLRFTTFSHLGSSVTTTSWC